MTAAITNANASPKELVVNESFRALEFKDGAFSRVLAPGRYRLPPRRTFFVGDSSQRAK